MLPDLTPAAARALEKAQQRARAEGDVDVRSPHLLAGLLDEEEGRVADMLVRAGLTPEASRRAFARLPTAEQGLQADKPLPLSPEARAALVEARELAIELGSESEVTTEALLLVLLREDEALRRRLQEQGLDYAHLEAQAASMRGPPVQLDEPLDLAEPTESIDTARIVDAGANRAREALRVIEDYCRFVLDDGFLSGEVKRLRHDLAEVLAELPDKLLLQARETLRDVGTVLTTRGEQERHSLAAVAAVNLKRLQEALRSLEEYGKLHSPELGQAVEKLRYRSYTLERAVVLGERARRQLANARLYVLVTGSLCSRALDWTIQEATEGGAQIIQLREKQLGDRALLERARQVRLWTRRAGVLFILNDRADIARLVEADGVHLGQDDLPVKEARRILGPDALIGVSTHDLDQVRQAVLDGASYIGVGPTFPSGTKDFTDFPGLDFVRQATAETSLPAFVLGGINLATIDAAVAAGAQRVAVSQVICQAEEPCAVAAALLRRLP